ncbi:hypothetical protein [Streptomyces purpurogeneiscleroticus]|uniref:hypothetical protein n=1 Tax=Streptomyces purpurogeneiscleroticus TaxID=68259 RepID=UPI001CBACFF2|nr:hypothetical protein [Streptomyces purpurogeneiscleroticus]MBZ4017187.1 hypothetical protein [Streptomyces purpurogeneiscleroticus]
MRPPRFTVCTCTAFTACVVLAGTAHPAGRLDGQPGPVAATAGVTARTATPPPAEYRPVTVERRPVGGMNSGRSAGLVVAGGVALVVIGRIVHMLRKRGGGDAE